MSTRNHKAFRWYCRSFQVVRAQYRVSRISPWKVRMYDSDSFFTLGVPAQVGLAMLSLVLAGGMLGLTLRVTRTLSLAFRVVAALVLFALFDWLSPQIYYAYYLAIIPGLPFQAVVAATPDPMAILRLLTFSGSHDLSAHGRGALGWAMLGAAMLNRYRTI